MYHSQKGRVLLFAHFRKKHAIGYVSRRSPINFHSKKYILTSIKGATRIPFLT